MDLLVPLQHGDELLDAPGTRLGLLGVVNAEDDRVAVDAVERGEKGFGLGMAVELRLQVVRHGGAALRLVGLLPLAVLFGAFDRREAGRLHLAARDERFRLLAVDLRPDAPRAARREFLQPEGHVVRLLLAVDPAVAERGFEGFGVGYGWDVGVLLCQLEPDAGRLGVVLGEPGGPRLLVLERQHRQVGRWLQHPWISPMISPLSLMPAGAGVSRPERPFRERGE